MKRTRKAASIVLGLTMVLGSVVNVNAMYPESSDSGKVPTIGITKSTLVYDHAVTYGSVPKVSGFYKISSYAKSYSDVTNDTITTENFLVVNGYQQDKKTKTATSTKTCTTSSTLCEISAYTSAYTHSTHTFKLKGYKDHVMNTSKSL